MDDEYANPYIPLPERSNLPEICDRINRASPMNKDIMANRIMEHGYLETLFGFCREVEDELRNNPESQQLQEEMFMLFNLVKGVFLLNDQPLLELLLREEYMNDLISVLEYDPLLPVGTSHNRHREFLGKAKFQQPVPIPDADILSKIKTNYRMIYIKDVVLLRYLDDTTMTYLNSLIFSNNYAIVTGLLQSDEFMKNFRSELHRLAGFTPKKATQGSYLSSLKRKSKDANDSEVGKKVELRKQLFLFLQELCVLAKNLQIPTREEFYKKLNEYDVFPALEDALAASPPVKEERWLWLCIADIITNTLNHDPALLRTYMITRLSVPHSLLSSLVEAVVSPNIEAGLADQIAQILRMLLDPDSMQNSDKDLFLDHFYQVQVQKVTAALSQPFTASHPFQVSQYQACELLSCCVHQHGYRIKQHILNHNVMGKMGELLKVTKGRSNIVCGAIRFLRTCVALKDDMILRQICNQKVLDLLVGHLSLCI